MTVLEIKESIVNSLTPYLQKTDGAFDEAVLSFVVDGVLTDARRLRHYPADYTEDMINADMSNGIGTFRNVALSRYAKVGSENEKSHSEGDVSRNYEDFGKEWSGWLPLAVI